MSWTDLHKNKYLWLFKYLTTLDDKYKALNQDDFLLKFNKRTLIKIVKDNPNWGDSSKESIFYTC